MQATVSIKTVYPPGEGKTNWAIVANDGVRYSVKPEFSQLLKEGASVGVTYEVKSYNGKDVRMASHISAMGAAPANQQVPTRSNGNGHTQSREMFIMGCVGRAMGSGQFNATDIKVLTLAAAEAWDALGH